MRKLDVRELFYITHIENIPSILERGILSHERIAAEQVHSADIYDRDIANLRNRKTTPDGKNLWTYANLYFQPRNPMMYRVVHETGKADLAVVGIDKKVLFQPGVFITDGNAANEPTQFYVQSAGLKMLQQQWSVIRNEWWNNLDGSKRRIMAECLVPDRINVEHIRSIYVACENAQALVKGMVEQRPVSIVPEPNMFFQPNSRTKIGDNISLINGDMFFSSLQTLTISVNLQGVMGKGLASRAKYQFPDVYVAYQDACRAKQITETKPYLYKREASLEEELADYGSQLDTPNAVKWFLLFATKRRWQENSRMDDIEGGLQWVRDNFRKQGIQSLAIPALGCGLGRLKWKDVGPLMCRYLHGLGITVAIYLPREGAIPAQYLTQAHLLG